MVRVSGCSWTCLSIFAKFRGGKAVATSAGVLLCYSPVVLQYCCIFTLLFTTRYVSLSSMVTAVVAVIASIVSGDKIFIIAMCLLGMVIYKHRANIGRIINKTEPKANFSKAKIRCVTHITQKNVKHINSVFCVIFILKKKQHNLEELYMNLSVTKATQWYKNELNLQSNETLRFFVQYGGCSTVQKDFL